MKRNRIGLTALMLALLAMSVSWAEGPEELLLSAWKNQRGSVLYITSVDGDAVTGYYVNNAPNWNCQGTPFPVTGNLNGSAFTFSVDWTNGSENCNSVTAWTGVFSGGTLYTNWNLAVSGSTSLDQVIAGQDTFQYVSATEKKHLLQGLMLDGAPLNGGVLGG